MSQPSTTDQHVGDVLARPSAGAAAGAGEPIAAASSNTQSTSSSPSSAQPILSTRLTGASPKKAPPAGKKKHKSVKSLTREYETHNVSPSSSFTSFPSIPSSADVSSSSSGLTPPKASAASLQGQQARDRASSHGSLTASGQHAHQASVLLASPSYPSTLNIEDPRPRTLSASSTSSYSAQQHGRSASSVRLASPSYPSSFLPPERQSSSGTNTGSGSSMTTQIATTAGVPSSSRETHPLKMHRRKQSKEKAERERQEQERLKRHQPQHGGESSEPSGLPIVSISTDDLSSAQVQTELEDDELYEDMDAVGELGTSSSSSLANGLSSSNGDSHKPFAQMTPAERREHSRRHSRVHERNLSAFFPQPGTEAEEEADQAKAKAAYAAVGAGPDPIKEAGRPAINISSSPDLLRVAPSMDRRNSSNTSSIGSFISISPASDMELSPSKSKRGHHHRHSVSFAAYDQQPSATDTAMYLSKSHSHDHHERMQGSHDHHHRHHDHDHGHGHEHGQAHAVEALNSPGKLMQHLPTLPASARPRFLFGSLNFGLGAALWVAGQAGDSLAVTGLGYLVVFDAFGVLSEVGSRMAQESWRQELDRRYRSGGKMMRGHTSVEQIRRPYGPHRFETILHFSQSIYLLFSAIYVLKESIEHALLEGSEEHEEADVGLVLPTWLLLLATAVCIFSNVVLKNHAKLVAACGISTAASAAQSMYSGGRGGGHHARRTSVLTSPTTIAGPFLGLFANPFSLTVLFFSASLLFSAVFMPPFQVAALDKVLAGLESLSMFCIAYPASKALGLVLLQTAPPPDSPQYVQLIKALQRLEEEPLVTYIAPPRIWQLTPSTSAVTSSDGASPRKHNSFANLTQSTSRAPALIANVQIFLKSEASDAELHDLTRKAWERLAPSVGAVAGLRAGESLRGGMRAGEIVIQVEREGKKEYVMQHHTHAHASDHHHHHHGHGHSHTNDHSHGHDHDHDHHQHEHHGHAHSHVPDISHSHSQGIGNGNGHSHGHAHSHASHAHASDASNHATHAHVGSHHHHHH
ncbi:hypothetical protein K437DRAFT_254218 [Tilletiaria anomala UBC 951]|uniref:Cation efflux protein transmembrane domain-containing protein n=1 Tax=Tilletiaria anomala (strain ATCC 24038 / CBS 436.72 / UBC 951) TaxID=1037660 RepID=A0A066WF97_TILAU|nr:uncharacterized protein K437DRAFT_254218 [Tilletiaria anomala UBC 951]KDN52441.1 hypothetical protein K437DRAFT_254218 [Tilletiaria anomala UBC 951]